MSARDELATLIASRLDSIFGSRDFGPATQDYTLADAILAEFVLVRRSELPETFNGVRGNGICTALAQEFFQPELSLESGSGKAPGQWNREIAYANLAVALAIESHEPTP